MSSINYRIWAFIVVMIVFFPFYLFYLQSISQNSGGNRLQGTFTLNDNDIISQAEKILSSLEEEHDLLDKIILSIDNLISQASSAIESSALTSNHDELMRIRSLLQESLHKLKNSQLDEIPIKEPLTSNIDRMKTSAVASNNIPDPVSLSYNHDQLSSSSGSVLIVGGTDGSGTRRVVQVLTDLGVRMVSEDPETYDIHADGVGGWPPTVTSVLRETKSLDYDPTRLKADTQHRAIAAINRIINQADRDSTKPTSTILAVGGQLPRPPGKDAIGVKYGFKAPVAMTLVPLWAHALNDFKFLHVLRDGRDIAFSANQGPVEKFYDVMYGKRSGDVTYDAIRLWSDWNSQVYHWATRRTSLSSDKKKFSYFALHAEDLVSISTSIRFAAIYHLAKWVGSDLNDDEICCVTVKNAEFLGSHDRDLRQHMRSNKQVNSRYGKWKELLKGDHDLEMKLMNAGKEGLSIFGYEPLRQLADDHDITSSGYICTLTEQLCIDKKIILAPAMTFSTSDLIASKDTTYSMNGQCKVYRGVDFKGADVKWYDFKVDDPSHCCRDCIADSQCHHFTIDLRSNVCYHKSSRGKVTNSIANTNNLISGDAGI